MGSFASAPLAAAESGGSRLSSIGAAVGLGSAKNPIHMMRVRTSPTAGTSAPCAARPQTYPSNVLQLHSALAEGVGVQP